ncbi:MAG: hypothetical protein RI958_2163 [Actinomycetota bacterium]
MGTFIAVVVPLAFLAGAVALSRGGRRTAPLVLGALVWGVAVTFVVRPINDQWLTAYGYLSVVTVGAPIIEEIAKSFALPGFMRSRRASWFVDGAVLGLAAGTGFAIRENLAYLSSASDGQAIGLAVARTTSTNLMHAGCTALVGAALGSVLGRRLHVQAIACLGSLVVAIGLHSGFNRLTDESSSALLVTMVGVGVFVAAMGIVALGFPVAGRWSQLEMSRRGLSAGEQAALVGGGSVDDLLDEFERRFGASAVESAERLIVVQREIGVVARGGRSDPERLAMLTDEADQLRRDVGVFPMAWLRSHLPVDPSASGVWADLAPAIDESPATGQAPGGLWASLDRDEH